MRGAPDSAELYPEAVRMAKRLHRANPKTGERRSLAKIAAELAKVGHVNMAKYRGANRADVQSCDDQGDGRRANALESDRT